MSGIIRTYQKCPRCGASFPSSKGSFPIICNPCKTQPTKYFISYFWAGKREKAYHDRSGRTFHDWGHVMSALGEIRSKMADHKTGKGFFDPSTYKAQSSTSFSAFWSKFLEKYTDSAHEKIDAIGRHHMSYFADFQMRDIVSWHIDEWWRELKQKGLSPRYLNDILTWCRAFFRDAHKLEVIEKIPAVLIDLSVKVPAPDVDEWLTEDEQLAVLGHIPEHDRPIFDFLFLTGCRVNESAALQRTDIDKKNGVVTLRNTVKRDGSVGIVKNKKPRRIPYNAVKDCLDVDIISLTGFVFVNKWGRRYSDDYLRDAFNRACDDAGVKRIKLKNATRHSFGMGLLRKGFDIWQTSKIMNHSDIKITEHYAKMLDSEMSRAYGRSEPKVRQLKKDGK